MNHICIVLVGGISIYLLIGVMLTLYDSFEGGMRFKRWGIIVGWLPAIFSKRVVNQIAKNLQIARGITVTMKKVDRKGNNNGEK